MAIAATVVTLLVHRGTIIDISVRSPPTLPTTLILTLPVTRSLSLLTAEGKLWSLLKRLSVVTSETLSPSSTTKGSGVAICRTLIGRRSQSIVSFKPATSLSRPFIRRVVNLRRSLKTYSARCRRRRWRTWPVALYSGIKRHTVISMGQLLDFTSHFRKLCTHLVTLRRCVHRAKLRNLRSIHCLRERLGVSSQDITC